MTLGPGATEAWRERVDPAHLTIWDRLVERMRSNSAAAGLPDDLSFNEVQLAVLYTAEARGLLKLDGMDTARPGMRFSPKGAEHEAVILGLAGGDVQQWMNAVRAVNGEAAIENVDTYYDELLENEQKNRDAREQAAAPGLDSGSADQVWQHLAQMAALDTAGKVERRVLTASDGRVVSFAWFPKGLGDALSQLASDPEKFAVFSSGVGVAVVAPFVFVVEALLQRAEHDAQSSGFLAAWDPTQPNPDGLAAELLRLANKPSAPQETD